MNQFSFTRNTPARRLRTAPSRYLDSRLRGTVELSQGDHPPDLFRPYPSLPVQFQDVTTERWIVIPMGRIVSCHNSHSPSLVAAPNVSHVAHETIVGPHGKLDGNVPGYINTDGTLVNIAAATSRFGYGPDIAGLLVPANGGNMDIEGADTGHVNPGGDSLHPYSANDVGVTWNSGLTAYIATGDLPTTLGIPSNFPIGVAHSDIYQDIRGQYLNDQMLDQPVGVLTDWLITVPCIAVQDLVAQYNGSTQVTGFHNFCAKNDAEDEIHYLDDGAINLTAVTGDLGYAAAMKYFSFFYYDGGYPWHAMSGIPLLSDSFGNFVSSAYLQGEAGTLANTVSQALEGQMVGRLLTIDHKHPKSSLETVSTFHGSENPGTETRGIDWVTYHFAKIAMTAMGFTPSATDIYDAIVTDRVIGAAHISLSTM